MNANYNGLLMVMGGLSMGIGFALKDTIENIISGLSLMLGRLRRGDMIECDGYRGRVSSLGYRSTMIETLDGSIIAFQNSQLFNKSPQHDPQPQIRMREGGSGHFLRDGRGKGAQNHSGNAGNPAIPFQSQETAWCWTVSETVPSIWAYGSGFPS